eukprot:7990780-Karenia_brevis.AAC.1
MEPSVGNTSATRGCSHPGGRGGRCKKPLALVVCRSAAAARDHGRSKGSHSSSWKQASRSRL